jgi:CO dehydrogenase maturation factor
VVLSTRRVISVSGKGGTGKTTLTALLLKYLIQCSDEPILVVDADPATNLPEVLGVKIGKTVGMVTDELKKRIADGAIPPMVSKEGMLEAWVFETLVETERFDLLAMGRSEGEGCYCYVNSVLTKILDTLTSNYTHTLMDMEAGLEHLSRRTDQNVDTMLVTTDPSKMGLETARRIKELTKEVHINVGHLYLVGNQFPAEMEPVLQQSAEKIGLEFAGVIPLDSNIASYNMLGKPLLELPEDAPSYRAAIRIAEKIGL